MCSKGKVTIESVVKCQTEVFMNSERNVTILDTFVYVIVMFLANAIGTLATFLLNAVIMNLVPLEGTEKLYPMFVALYAAVGIAVTIFVTRFYFRYKISDIVPKKHEYGDRQKLILSNYLYMVLPGEILRFILASLPTKPGILLGRGYRFFDGLFAFPANFVYDRVYLMPQGRFSSILEHGYTFTDNILFIMIYLVYFVLSLFLLYLVFSKVWDKYEEERKNEFKIHMDPEQMK